MKLCENPCDWCPIQQLESVISQDRGRLATGNMLNGFCKELAAEELETLPTHREMEVATQALAKIYWGTCQTQSIDELLKLNP